MEGLHHWAERTLEVSATQCTNDCLEHGRVIYMALFLDVSWFSRLKVPFEMVNTLL